MTLMIAGIILWALVHLFRRVAPGLRDGLVARIGLGPVKGLVSLASFAALALIILGYRSAPFVAVFEPPVWGKYVNNPLMFAAVVLFGMGSSRGRLRSLLRHPMLTGVLAWSLAHMLVNGDLAGLVLFGGMALWALAEILLINATDPPWTRPEPGPAAGDIRLIGISVAIFAVITVIHVWIGPSPFPV